MFYNALTQSDQDSLNAATDGNLLNRTPRDALTIIENKSKVRTSRNKSIVSKVSTTSSSSSLSSDITALTDMVMELVLMNKANQQASMKVVEEIYVTCGGPHPYYDCLATDSNTFNAYAATGTYNQEGPGYRPQGDPNYRASNQMGPPGFPPSNFLQYTQLAILEFRDTLIQHVESVKKSIDERALHKREYDARVNERQIQITKDMVDSSKALDASLVDTESSGTALKEQDTSSRSGNDAHADDADIRPIYDEEPMAEVQTTAEINVFAIGQQHTEQPEFNNDGEVDQNAEQCHDTCPFPATLTDNQTTELSNQPLESENIRLKKTVAQFQKDFSRMEAHCVNLELKYQNQVLKEGQHGQFSKVKSNEAKVPSNKTTKRYIPVEQTSFAKKPERQIPKRHRSSIKKTSVVHEKTITHRSCLRWKPTGKVFKTVGLRWVPTGKIFTSSTTKVDNEPISGSNDDITNQYECKQNLDVSVVLGGKGRMPTKIELTLEQSQQGVSNDVLNTLRLSETCQGDPLNLPAHRSSRSWEQLRPAWHSNLQTIDCHSDRVPKMSCEMKSFISGRLRVVDYDVDPWVPLILGRPFLRTERALIDVHGEEITLRVNDEAIMFKVGHTSRYSRKYYDETVHQVNILDVACEEYAQEVLEFSNSSTSAIPTHLDPIIASSSPSFTPFEGDDFVLEKSKLVFQMIQFHRELMMPNLIQREIFVYLRSY
ncbi:hypothetical protein Tco_0693453 [Tanacetum coccineum]